MNNDWKNKPTVAGQVIARAMQEHGWKQGDVAAASGVGENTISRWYRGSVIPPDYRVASMAARLGYDPSEFGLTSPRAVAAAAEVRDHVIAPAWAVEHHTELMEAIGEMKRCLGMETDVVRRIESQLTNVIRKT